MGHGDPGRPAEKHIEASHEVLSTLPAGVAQGEKPIPETQKMPIAIPQFLIPRGAPSATALRTLRHHHRLPRTRTTPPSCSFSSTTTTRSPSQDDSPDSRVLGQPDKFCPPSHPARRVVQTRNGRVVGSNNPVNYPGPRLSEQEKEEKKSKQYPNMFPPEGTVMHQFLTSRWIHVWITMVPNPLLPHLGLMYMP